MVRAPCCEKMGLKKGPWTREEDQILINYIHHHGHPNWRALPKQAGLLRCGKSCRLRWTNYLRPDIKRGNFTREEEDTIIQLHEVLGNRWSAIAARLPGRTDNEIKNVWHTHLKKRLGKSQSSSTQSNPQLSQSDNIGSEIEPKDSNYPIQSSPDYPQISSPQHSSSFELSSSATTNEDGSIGASTDADVLDNFSELDENFWSDVWSTAEDSGDVATVESPVSPLLAVEGGAQEYNSMMHDGMDFWYHLFTRAEDLQELPNF